MGDAAALVPLVAIALPPSAIALPARPPSAWELTPIAMAGPSPALDEAPTASELTPIVVAAEPIEIELSPIAVAVSPIA